MSLFPSANDFKAGPGVEKDAPRKTGVGRFFELVGRDMSSMFLANLLTCLGFLPVICLVYIGFLMNSLPVMLVSAAVGGILAGFSNGLVLTCGASCGGLDILGLYLSKKTKGFTVGRFSLLFNAVLYAMCLVLFSAPTAIYSAIYTVFNLSLIHI